MVIDNEEKNKFYFEMIQGKLKKILILAMSFFLEYNYLNIGENHEKNKQKKETYYKLQ